MSEIIIIIVGAA